MAGIALIVSMIFWSISGIAIKHALLVLPPFTLIVMRFTPAVMLMLIIGLVCRKSDLFALQRMDKRDLPLFIAAGFCQPFLYYLLETFSYRALNSPTVAEALLSTSPLLAPLFAAVSFFAAAMMIVRSGYVCRNFAAFARNSACFG